MNVFRRVRASPNNSEKLRAVQKARNVKSGQEYDNGTAIKHDLTSTNIH